MKQFILPMVLLFGIATSAMASVDPNAESNRGIDVRNSSTRTSHMPRGNAGSLGLSRTGIASYYWEPQALASGGWFNPNAMTAAHKTLPFGTRVRVRHLGNGGSVDVRINDRGPYVAGRIIDLSKGAAAQIGMTKQGVTRVSMTVLGR